MNTNICKTTTITLNETEIIEIIMDHFVNKGYSENGMVQIFTKKNEDNRLIVEAEYCVEEDCL